MRTTRAWVAAGVLVLTGSGAGFMWFRTQPEFTDDEQSQARIIIERQRLEAEEYRCSRPVFGEASPATEDAFGELLSDPGVRDCLTRVTALDRNSSLRGPLTETRFWTWQFARGTAPPDEPAPPGKVYTDLFGPPPAEPVDVVVKALRGCEDLTGRIDALAANPDLCSPHRPTRPGWTDVRVVGQPTWMARTLAVIVRHQRAREDLAGGIDFLLRSIAVVRDLRRGPTSMMSAMGSVAAEHLLQMAVLGYFAGDPDFTQAEYRRIEQTIERLLTIRSTPGILFRTDKIAAVDLASPDELGFALAFAAYHDTEGWCPDSATGLTCLSNLMDQDGSPFEDEVGESRILGSRVGRAERMESAVAANRDAWATYMARQIALDISLHMLGVIVRLAALRSQHDQCPPAIDPALLDVGLEEPIVIEHYTGAVFEVTAPPLPDLPDFDRLVMRFMCPAATAGWDELDPDSSR